MRRPDPTPRQKQRQIKASQFRFRMEFVIDFDRPISVLKGRETARKLLDALDLDAGSLPLDDAFGGASIRCAELRRILKIAAEVQIGDDGD